MFSYGGQGTMVTYGNRSQNHTSLRWLSLFLSRFLLLCSWGWVKFPNAYHTHTHINANAHTYELTHAPHTSVHAPHTTQINPLTIFSCIIYLENLINNMYFHVDSVGHLEYWLLFSLFFIPMAIYLIQWGFIGFWCVFSYPSYTVDVVWYITLYPLQTGECTEKWNIYSTLWCVSYWNDISLD